MTEKQGIEAAILSVAPLMRSLSGVSLLAAGQGVVAGIEHGHCICWLHWSDMQRAVLETN